MGFLMKGSYWRTFDLKNYMSKVEILAVGGKT